jgi:Holliday junction resolvasome RuvABC endonuclease subunit
MSLAKLKKTSNKVLGVDASTNTIAFCLMDGKTPVKWGEITFTGSTVYDRILDAKRKVRAFKTELDYDFVAIEKAVMVRSAHTGIIMAYIFGAIMGELLSDGIEVKEVPPITWQSYIGNKNFTKIQKEEVKKQFPGKTDNWYKNQIRKMRKQKTMDFAQTLGINTTNDNVGDSVGIAWYAVNELV